MKKTLFKDGDVSKEITDKAKEIYKNNTVAAAGVLSS